MNKIAGYICMIMLTIIMSLFYLVFPSEAAQVTTSLDAQLEYGDVYSTSSGDADAEISETTESDIASEFDELKMVIILLVGIVLGATLGVLVVGL